MRVIFVVLFFLSSTILAGCLSQGGTMMLLDEKISKIEVSKSTGVGNVNEEILISFEDKQSIRVFEQAIRNALEMKVDTYNSPDYDVVVSYGDQFPMHAIHIWLGDKKQFLLDANGNYMTDGDLDAFRTLHHDYVQVKEFDKVVLCGYCLVELNNNNNI